MRNINLVVLMGSVGSDPRFGTGKNGSSWANLSLATQKKMRDNSFVTTWHRVAAFGKTADIISSCRKGDILMVEGELENNQYTDKNGQKVTSTSIVARSAMKGIKESESFAPESDFGQDQGGFEYPEQGGM